MYDRYITVFSPEGKLFQVEYAINAVKKCGLTGISLRGKDSVVTVVQRKVPEKLMERDYVTSLYKITPEIGCLALGRVPDCKNFVARARQAAAKFKNKNGYNIPVHVLAEKIGKIHQLFTQNAGLRLAACTMQLCAIDDERGPQLYKVEPSGHFFGWKAAASGAKESEAVNCLEKIIRKTNLQSDVKETIIGAIDALQTVLHEDLKAANIEVSVCTKDSLETMTDEAVEELLNELAERD